MKDHGMQVIREVRESRPADYLKIVAMIISRCDAGASMSDDLHDDAVEQIIEERRQRALALIAKMQEPQ